MAGNRGDQEQKKKGKKKTDDATKSNMSAIPFACVCL